MEGVLEGTKTAMNSTFFYAGKCFRSPDRELSNDRDASQKENKKHVICCRFPEKFISGLRYLRGQCWSYYLP